MTATVERSVADKLRELDAATGAEAWRPLHKWAQVTALRDLPGQGVVASHWWRGPLLYRLVQHYRPCHVLEFGTGRGYGAICMAQAAEDAGIDCTIWTIDRIPPHAPQTWLLDVGDGPVQAKRALADVWAAHVPGELTRRIRCLTGESWRVMRRWRSNGLPAVEFSFIDGGHDYWTAKHDFLAVAGVAASGCAIVFDDYTAREDYGVRRLVEQEIAPHLPAGAVEAIQTGFTHRMPDGRDVAHEMALLRGEHVTPQLVSRLYRPEDLRAFRRRHALRRLGGQVLSGLRAVKRRVPGRSR